MLENVKDKISFLDYMIKNEGTYKDSVHAYCDPELSKCILNHYSSLGYKAYRYYAGSVGEDKICVILDEKKHLRKKGRFFTVCYRMGLVIDD